MRDLTATPGLRVTVMGLGVHGGGLASALFFARRGAEVTVTDLRGPDALAPSIERLAGLPVRYVLGRHDVADFESADLVIKNPAVPTGSPFLAAARDRAVPVETDVSVFLSLARCPVIAVTGTKGKSTTASAIHHGLLRASPRARLGGNITVSPLEFLDDLAPTDPVVLELSSWQLGDLGGPGCARTAHLRVHGPAARPPRPVSGHGRLRRGQEGRLPRAGAGAAGRLQPGRSPAGALPRRDAGRAVLVLRFRPAGRPPRSLARGRRGQAAHRAGA